MTFQSTTYAAAVLHNFVDGCECKANVSPVSQLQIVAQRSRRSCGVWSQGAMAHTDMFEDIFQAPHDYTFGSSEVDMPGGAASMTPAVNSLYDGDPNFFNAATETIAVPALR